MCSLSRRASWASSQDRRVPVDMYTWTFYGLHKRHLFQIEMPIWFPTVYPQPLSIILGAKSSPVHWQPRLESQPVGSASLVPSDPFHSSSFLGIVFCVSDPTSPCRWPSRSHCLLGFLACCSASSSLCSSTLTHSGLLPVR